MRTLAYFWARLRGWSFVGVIPPVPKMIVVGAPHTTNWDFVIFLAALHHFDIRVRYLAKHTLFRPPFGWFFKRTGGIPVDRTKASGVVAQVAGAFRSHEEMVLVVAPEGTRRAGRWWKSGFLKIAEAAGVPLVLAGIDYETKTVTLSEGIDFDGDVGRFMDRARVFFADARGLKPGFETPIVLREELRGS